MDLLPVAGLTLAAAGVAAAYRRGNGWRMALAAVAVLFAVCCVCWPARSRPVGVFETAALLGDGRARTAPDVAEALRARGQPCSAEEVDGWLAELVDEGVAVSSSLTVELTPGNNVRVQVFEVRR